MKSPDLSVLIVDDEPPGRRRLRSLLEMEPDVRVVGECGDGATAVREILELAPDLVLLDVQMPEGDGFAVLEGVGPERMPAVIFVTAYDQYALQAFGVHAVDYLLKPFDRDRFQEALRRARERLAPGRREEVRAALHELLAEVRPAESRWLARFTVRTGARIRFVESDAVDYIAAESGSNYVRLHAGKQSYLLRDTLSALEEALDPARFLRVHRSLIVNLSRIEELEPLFAGEYQIYLRGGTRLTSGRTYRAKIQEALRLRP